MADALQDAVASLGAVVAERWFVVEITPSYRDWDDVYHPPKKVIRSQYYESEFKAQEFLDKHEPDEGNILKVTSQKLYERVERRWI